MAENLQTFLDLLKRRNEAGERVFSKADIDHLLPAVMLAAGSALDLNRVSPEIQDVFRRFCVTVGITNDSTPEQIQKTTQAYYAENPIRPNLVTAINQLLRDLTAQSSELGGPLQAMAKLINTPSNESPGLARPPKGGVQTRK